MFDMKNADRLTLARLPSITMNPKHDHSTNAIVGYIVRHSVIDGELAPAKYPNRPGADVAIYRDAFRFNAAVATAKDYRHGLDYAAVDKVYACGCRS